MSGNRRLTPWTDADDADLVRLHEGNACLTQMMIALGRSGEAIDKRLARLGLRRTGRRRQAGDRQLPTV